MKDFTANIYRQLGCTNHSDTDRDINDFYATEEKAVRCLINEGGQNSLRIFLSQVQAKAISSKC